MSRRHRTSRRRVLQGLGLTMALPFLEYFAPKTAHAQEIPKRFAFLFGGFSIGSYGEDEMAPASEGPLAGNLTRGLASLQPGNLTDVVSLVSGLEIPVGIDPPVAGRPASFHSTAHQVLATGQRYDMNAFGQLAGPSSDQVAAKYIAGDTLQDSLIYRAQPSFYRVGNADGGTDGVISARINAMGELEQLPPITSPRLAFESLFSGFTPPDPEEAAKGKALLAMRKSVVDLVADHAGTLIPKLGKADNLRMQRHFDELRSLEKRLEQIELPDSPSCALPPHPGDDPPIGDAIDPSGGGNYNDYYKNADGYSDEELRATIMTDLIHMAFACDISRVASFMITHAQCFMNLNTVLNMPSDLHEVTHGAIGDNSAEMQAALADIASWHISFYARLVEKLRDTQEVDGSSLLDHSAIVMAFEGGWGFDLESGGGSSPHSTENMVMLVGGRAGGMHSSPGRHIRAQGVHPTAVLNTALEAVGVPETLGEVPDRVDTLLDG
jgi:Protein of unknown function (DUF1552)